jgi:hypothetical protein
MLFNCTRVICNTSISVEAEEINSEFLSELTCGKNKTRYAVCVGVHDALARDRSEWTRSKGESSICRSGEFPC